MTNQIIGRKAPALSLPDADGHVIELSALLKKGPVVVFFYPKDQTPGCTKQACSFRDAYEKFLEHGCQVVGVSRDAAQSHQQFVSKHRLPFLLLSDADGKTAKTWGVKKTLGLMPGRETFLIDQQQIIRHHFASQISIESHVQGTLEALRALRQ